MTLCDHIHLLEWLCWLASLVRITDYLLLLEWLCMTILLVKMTLYDYLQLIGMTCYNNFVWLLLLKGMSLFDYLHFLEWLSHDYLHLLE